MLSNILKKISLVLAMTVALSSLNSTGALAAEKVKYGAAIKDGKLYSLEIREDSVTAVPASKSNPVNDKYGDKYFSQNTYKDFTVFDRYGNATTYDYKSNSSGTINGIESCKLEDEEGNKYLFYQKSGIFPFKYDYASLFIKNKNRIIVIKNNKEGLIDNNGKEIVECKYDNIHPDDNGKYYIVTNNEKKGVLDSKGMEIIPCNYDDIYSIHRNNSLFYVEKNGKKEYINVKNKKNIIYDYVFCLDKFTIVRKNGKLGVINNSGREILKCEYDEIGEKYDDGYLGIFGFYKLNNVKKNGKWGYVDNRGKVKVKFKYDNAETFYGKFARVGSKGDWRFINKKGKEVYKFNYEDMGSLYDGSVCAKKNGKWGIVDKNNKVLVDFIYEDIGYDFGPVAVKKEGKWGIIDKKGNVIISFAYDGFSRISDKLFSVKKEGKWGIIDNKENIIQDFKFDKKLYITYQDNSKDRFIYTESNGNHGILNTNGKEIYPAESEDYIFFRGDVAIIKKNEKYGAINKKGNVIYPAESEEHIWVDGDVAIVKKNGKYGAINKEGRIIYPITADSMEIYGGLVEVSNSIDGQGYKSGLFDSNGNEVLPIKYNGIDYQNGVFTVYDGKYGIFNIKGKQILPLEYDKIYIFGSNN